MKGEHYTPSEELVNMLFTSVELSQYLNTVFVETASTTEVTNGTGSFRVAAGSTLAISDWGHSWGIVFAFIGYRASINVKYNESALIEADGKQFLMYFSTDNKSIEIEEL